jgi:hypothetical protein
MIGLLAYLPARLGKSRIRLVPEGDLPSSANPEPNPGPGVAPIPAPSET